MEQTRIIEQLNALYFQYTGTIHVEVEDKARIGVIFPKYDKKFIAYFMMWWVDYMDGVLDSVPPNSNQYADLLGRRGVTIEEFKNILSGYANEENYKHERAFEYLYIYDKLDHNYFISKHSIDEEKDLLDKYYTLVTEIVSDEIPLLHEFFFASKINLYFPLSSLQRHAYILGASGSGKSEIIKNLWYDLQLNSSKKNNKTLVALEPSGKLIKELLQIHLNNENPKRVVYLDSNIRKTAEILLGEDIFKEDYTFVLNPLELTHKTTENLNYMTPAISSAVFELMDEESKKGQMSNLIKACVDLLLEMDNTSLIDLRDINDEDTPSKYMSEISKMRNSTRRGFMENKFGSRRMETSKNGIYQRVHDIIDDMYLTRIFTGSNTVDLEHELNSGKIILFNPTSLQKQSIQAYGKLLVCLIQGYIEKRKDRVKKSPMKTFMFIDEAHNYMTPSIEKIMAESRKFGLHMILANQVLGQNMDTEMRRIILGNTAIKVSGDNEPDSLKVMAKSMGGMNPKEFDNLPKYHFYVHDRNHKKAGSRVFKASGKFVDANSPYYMNKKQLKDFLLWTVYESGYYKKLSADAIPTSKEATSESINKGTLKPIWTKD